MEESVVPFELSRMFLGDHPPLFYAEIAFRTVVIYGYTLTLIRWIGGRSVAQLSMVDMLLVIALGSAVGDATFYDDVPLLQAMLVITVVVGLNKLLDTLIERSNRAKHLIDGRTVAVVRDGRILDDGLRRRDLSTLEVQAMLRSAGVANLGQVEAAYLEAGGGLSVFRRAEPMAGLPLVPPPDVHPRPELSAAGPGDAACCAGCGRVRSMAGLTADTPCDACGRTDWTLARTAACDELNRIV